LPALGICGVNVIVPHKVAVTAFLDRVDEDATAIGAVNTVFRDADGRLAGTNTDVAGFAAPLAGHDLAGATVVVAGSGGAARAVLFALARAQVGRVVMLARTHASAAALLDRFELAGEVLPLDAPLPPGCLLVNTTSLGMAGQPPLDLDLSPLPAGALVYDIVYAPLETPLLRAARARGLTTIDGLEMLVGQAAVAFERFFGVAAPRRHDTELRALLTA
jgi:shikimate dehydrogenase